MLSLETRRKVKELRQTGHSVRQLVFEADLFRPCLLAVRSCGLAEDGSRESANMRRTTFTAAQAAGTDTCGKE